MLNEKDSRLINRLRKSFQYACNHLISWSELILYNMIHEFSPVISFVVCLEKQNIYFYLMYDKIIIIIIINNFNLKYTGIKLARL